VLEKSGKNFCGSGKAFIDLRETATVKNEAAAAEEHMLFMNL
jgi:hypothetical protein